MPVTPPMRRAEDASQRPANPNPVDPLAIPEASRIAAVHRRYLGAGQGTRRPALLSRVMKAGETFVVPNRDNLILTTGNAARVDILVDGTRSSRRSVARARAQGRPAGPGSIEIRADRPRLHETITPDPWRSGRGSPIFMAKA